MGIKNLKQQLPWTDLRDWIAEFPGILLLVDAANILFWCARTNFATFVTDNYLPAVADFCKYMNYLVARKARVRLFFDGLVNPDKKFEDARRKATRERHKKAVADARVKSEPPHEGDLKALLSTTRAHTSHCAQKCAPRISKSRLRSVAKRPTLVLRLRTTWRPGRSQNRLFRLRYARSRGGGEALDQCRRLVWRLSGFD